MKDFLLIAITSPTPLPQEGDVINSLLRNGEVDFVHIRKPDYSEEETEKLLNDIEERFHPLLKLHDHFSLTAKYNLGGIHLNKRNPKAYPGTKSLSCSIHSLYEIDKADGMDYFFISPVYDSISKEGYKGAFDLYDLSDRIKGKRAVALGGVTPEKFDELKSFGFYGAAMLGHFWGK